MPEPMTRRRPQGATLAALVMRRVMPAALIGVAAIWAAVAYTERQQHTETLSNSLSESLEASAELVAAQIDQTFFSARSAARNAIAVSALFGQDIDRVVRPYLNSLVIGDASVDYARIVDFSGAEIVSTRNDPTSVQIPVAEGWIREALRGIEAVELRGDTVFIVLPIVLGATPEGALVLAVPRENLMPRLPEDRGAEAKRYLMVQSETGKLWPEVRRFRDDTLRGTATRAIPSAPAIAVVVSGALQVPSMLRDPVQWYFAIVFLLVLGLVALGIWLAIRLITQPITQLIEGLDRHGLEIEDLGAGAPTEIQTLSRRFADAGREVGEALRQEKQVSAQQRQFVAMVSHEFRTPLSIIDASAQALLRRRTRMSEELITRKLDLTRTSVSRLVRLMESTLAAGRLEEGRISADPGPVDLAKMIRQIVEDRSLTASDLRFDCDLDQAPERILADETLLYSVIDNLISNAIKYSPSMPEVAIRASVQDGMAVIAVRDHGIGIPAEEIERIGTRFFRASTSAGIAGTGIGLNLAQTILDLHAGWLSIESVVGQGSTFRIHLPIEGAKACETGIEAPGTAELYA
ncbi:MAG: ATP-binding protein [Pseudomonadota bacterium]